MSGGEGEERKRSRDPRAAGRRFEQRIAREMRAWLGPDWTVARNQTDRQKGQTGGCAGEFEFTGPFAFPLCVECKDGYGFRTAHLFQPAVVSPMGSTQRSEGFWRQASRQARVVGRRPLLVFRESGNLFPLAALRDRDGSLLFASRPPVVRMTVTVDGDRLWVVPWAGFLTANPGCLAELLERPRVPPPPPARGR